MLALKAFTLGPSILSRKSLVSLKPIRTLSCILYTGKRITVSSLGTCIQVFGLESLKRYRIPSPVCVGFFGGFSVLQLVPRGNCWWGFVVQQHLVPLPGCPQNPVAPFGKCRSSSKRSTAVEEPQTSNSTGGTWKWSPAGTCINC